MSMWGPKVGGLPQLLVGGQNPPGMIMVGGPLPPLVGGPTPTERIMVGGPPQLVVDSHKASDVIAVSGPLQLAIDRQQLVRTQMVGGLKPVGITPGRPCLSTSWNG